MAEPSVNNDETTTALQKMPWRFQEGNSGRPKGSKNKLTKEGLQAAREAFAPINEKVLTLMERHLDFHLASQNAIVEVLKAGVAAETLLLLMSLNDDLMRGNCPHCRHIAALSTEYTYGKPAQRIEMDEEIIHSLATEFGIAPEQVRRDLAEERKHLRSM